MHSLGKPSAGREQSRSSSAGWVTPNRTHGAITRPELLVVCSVPSKDARVRGCELQQHPPEDQGGVHPVPPVPGGREDARLLDPRLRGPRAELRDGPGLLPSLRGRGLRTWRAARDPGPPHEVPPQEGRGPHEEPALARGGPGRQRHRGPPGRGADEGRAAREGHHRGPAPRVSVCGFERK